MAEESKLGTAVVPIRATLDEIDKDMDAAKGKFEKGLSGIDKLFKNLGQGFMQGLGLAGGLGAADLAVKAVQGLKGIVDAGIEARNTTAELNAVLESTQGASGMTLEGLQRLAEGISGLSRFEDTNLQKAEGMLLMYKNIGQEVFPGAMQATADLGEKFGSLDSAALTLGRALEKPETAVTSLRRAHIMLTDAQQTAIDNFMAEGKIADAQKVILKGVEDAVGGLAKRMAEANPWDVFKNKIQATKEAIGLGILPTLDALMKALDTLSGPLLGNKQAWTDITTAVTGFLSQPLLDTLSNAAITMKILNDGLGLLVGQLNALGISTQRGSTAATAWAAAWNQVSNVVRTLAGGPLSIAAAAVGAVGNAIREIQGLRLADILSDLQLLGIDVQRITAWSGQMANTFMAALRAVGNSINSVIGGPLNALRRTLDSIWSGMSRIWNSFPNILHAAQTLHVPGFAAGGIVSGPVGAPQLAIVHGGEQISPPGQGGSASRIYIHTLNLPSVTNAAGFLRELEAMG